MGFPHCHIANVVQTTYSLSSVRRKTVSLFLQPVEEALNHTFDGSNEN
jgi:hypothetical protein